MTFLLESDFHGWEQIRRGSELGNVVDSIEEFKAVIEVPQAHGSNTKSMAPTCAEFSDPCQKPLDNNVALASGKDKLVLQRWERGLSRLGYEDYLQALRCGKPPPSEEGQLKTSQRL